MSKLNIAIYAVCIFILLVFAIFPFPVYTKAHAAAPPSFAIDDASITEGSQNVLIAVRKIGSSSKPSSISFQTVDETAVAGSDYVGGATTIVFAPNESIKHVAVSILDDSVVETTETFMARIAALNNARISDGAATITITDNDAANPPPQPTAMQPDPIPSNFNTADYLSAGDPPASESSDSPGAFRFICSASHESYDDPIVYPGQPGASHLHEFFGNTLTNAYSTYDSLRASGEGSCNNKLNRSGYWMPAMMNGKGKVVRPDYVSIYYKRMPKSDPKCHPESYARAQGVCVDLPRGLRYIFGYNMLTGQDVDTFKKWFDCDGTGATAGHYATIVEAAPNCPTGTHLGAIVVAPDCWDGANLDSADHRGHMAYADYSNGLGFLQCPAGYPFVIPQFQLGAWFLTDDDLDRSGSWDPTKLTWYLSSDAMPGMAMKVPGTTFHSDWFGAWDDGVKQTWHDNCIDRRLSCNSGNLGNGTIMTIPGGNYNLIANPRLVDPPPHP